MAIYGKPFRYCCKMVPHRPIGMSPTVGQKGEAHAQASWTNLKYGGMQRRYLPLKMLFKFQNKIVK